MGRGLGGILPTQLERQLGNMVNKAPFKDEALPPAVPAPPYRHAAPSGPWPWMDLRNINSDETVTTSVIVKVEGSEHTTDVSWRGYPQSLFGNWTPDQVGRSKMLMKCSEAGPSTIYWMDVLNSGKFCPSNVGAGCTQTTTLNENDFYNMLQRERDGIRVQSLCVDDLTKPVLQTLGEKFNIEPFFFTSSINWIPSRYQEALVHGQGDHITITLPFVRTLHLKSRTQTASQNSINASSYTPGDSQINTQAPFPLHDGNTLFIDLLAVHMVRGVETSTVISYHAESKRQTSAKHLHSLMLLVGKSVYWQNIFFRSADPTLLFLAILWYALYAWDESFESLYDHIGWLESEVLIESRIEHTRDLHILKAHLLHYESLLHDFQVSVAFILKTPNPAMENSINDETRKASKEMVVLECENLSSEISRLQSRRTMMNDRLKNVMDLALANVNIRESASMRQVTYLTMIFLPASLIASVFGMNVSEINPGSLETLDRYAEVTVALTLLTFYIVITVQTHTSFHERGAGWGRRAAWPILFPLQWVQKKITGDNKTTKSTDTSHGKEFNEGTNSV